MPERAKDPLESSDVSYVPHFLSSPHAIAGIHLVKMFALARLIAKQDWLWSLYKHHAAPFIVRVVEYRKTILIARILERFAPCYRVEDGLFKGMVYPSPKSYCSALVPKLLGTYESELKPTISAWRERAFPIIVDVGCAEGYYAVGLAQMFPGAYIHAFDSEPEARSLCLQMAALNGVDHRMTMHGSCHPSDLLTLNFDRGGLVICDCEGFEADLFSSDVARHLCNCCIIIETHDHPHEKGARMNALIQAFSGTHRLRVVHSIDDIQKSRYYRSGHVGDEDLLEREAVFAEWRPWIMHWLVAEPKY